MEKLKQQKLIEKGFAYGTGSFGPGVSGSYLEGEEGSLLELYSVTGSVGPGVGTCGVNTSCQ